MNILMFGPNGSGKGTQGAIVKDKYNLPHIESGAIFRENIGKGTDIGKKAKEYIDRGELVPDEITIPMILGLLSSTPLFRFLLSHKRQLEPCGFPVRWCSLHLDRRSPPSGVLPLACFLARLVEQGA